jgi:hypothetical protein
MNRQYLVDKDAKEHKVKVVSTSTLDPKITPPSFDNYPLPKTHGVQEKEELVIEEDSNPKPLDVRDETVLGEPGALYGEVPHNRHTHPEHEHLGDKDTEGSMETTTHDPGALVEKEDKAIVHDNLFYENTPAAFLPYND